MKRAACAALLGLCLAGCASPGGAPGVAPPDSGRGGDSGRLILLTVSNPPERLNLRAGSTPQGYDGMPLYAESNAAKAVLADVERDYSLREVSGWPIGPLQVHCVMEEIPPGVSRAARVRW